MRMKLRSTRLREVAWLGGESAFRIQWVNASTAHHPFYHSEPSAKQGLQTSDSLWQTLKVMQL